MSEEKIDIIDKHFFQTNWIQTDQKQSVTHHCLDCRNFIFFLPKNDKNVKYFQHEKI